MKILFALVLVAILFFACKNQISSSSSEGRTDIDVATAKQMIADDPSIVILDVRTPRETASGTLPNAIQLDYQASNFENEIAKLDKSKTYLVYCKSGGRSSSACNKMTAAGFSNVINMKGGYSSWD